MRRLSAALGDTMQSTFASWLAEIEREASPEPWNISLNCTPDFTYEVMPWIEFLRAAVTVRVRRHRDRAYSSYVWHDAQAFQLRFIQIQRPHH